VRLGGLGKSKKKIIDLMGTRTCDLPACSIAPQPSTLPMMMMMMMMMMMTMITMMMQ
jgi:hypothetical protein